MTALRDMAIGAVGLLAIVALWHLAAVTGLVSRAFLPMPEAAFNALQRGFQRGELAAQATATVLLMLKGWLLASAVAIGLGSLIGILPRVRAALEPTLEMMRPLPASAVIPVAIALFGLTPAMVVGVVAFGSLWPTLLATIHGFKSVEPRLIEVGRTLGLSRLAFIGKIGLPNALPDILGGMRLSLTVALILAIVTEMLAGQTGLGTAILIAGRSFRSPDLFAGMILLCVIGLLSNLMLSTFERRMLRWRTT
jgi:sulfonate transport system permease protein